ncbi:LOW QUALITY PROTEIN: nyctalopin-like [Dermochelys coriacea]|uniref:LOW QUALITY PROTEIN: nyctalopin-like n=1 Tax=Dermochelys coriacea TaxID=27794 RepID=UPI0018E7A7B5|nr:LOW QUALITY PROTEIN: nyctalopin-like [Dermochelys coriacea]
MFSLIISPFTCAARIGLGVNVSACPSVCKCSPDDTIHCNKAGLRALPAELAASVVSLNLSNNLLRILTANTFRNLTFLHSLWLDRNNLTFLYPGTFSVFSNLQELDLSWNSRLTLHANTFRGLSNLINLDLSSCNIFKIHPLVFLYLLSLQVLDLTSNNLCYIPQAFRSLSSLTRLSLERNHIEAIGRDSLKDLKALYELNLWKNRIWMIQNDAFAMLNRLGVLDLGHNHISDLPNKLFNGLIQLKTMHLEASRITRVNCSFNCLLNLRKLYLNHHHISSISHTAFSNLKKLQFLHLNKNNLSSLPKHLLAELPKLKYVFLSHNPWNCDCKMLWFPTWIATYEGAVEGMQCAFTVLHNQTLLDVFTHSELISCSIPPGLASADKCEETDVNTAGMPHAISDKLLWITLAWCAWHLAEILDKSFSGLGSDISAFFL